MPTDARRRPAWWLELLYVIVGYQLYRLVRAAAPAPEEEARENAELIIDIQRELGLLVEAEFQSWFLGWETFLKVWNVIYGTAHFAGPAIALLWLWWRFPDRYREWRTIFGWLLLVGLVTFWTWPLMPPRFYADEFGFVDTAVRYGGYGPLGQGSLSGGGNPFAAMPSLHIGWSVWVAAAVMPALRRWWTKALVALYPLVMLFAVTVTGNHWLLDAVGGAAAVLLAWGLERGRRRLVRWWRARTARGAAPTASPG